MDTKDYAERQRSITTAEQAAILEERLDPMTDADRPDLDQLEEDVREWKYVAMTQPIATLRWLIAAARDRDRLAAELAELRAAAAKVVEDSQQYRFTDRTRVPVLKDHFDALARLLPAKPEAMP